jgi:cytochrome c peroxidase
MGWRNNGELQTKKALSVGIFYFILFHSPFLPAALAQLADSRIQIGTQLFFDPRLSDDNSMSCVTCHRPDRAFTDGLPHAVGRRGKALDRNTPTLLHVGKLSSLFWDGRATTLEDQVLIHLQDPDIMNMSPDALVNKLAQVPGYVREFKVAYGSPVTWAGIANSIASFERTLGTRSAPIDHFYVGRNRAISITAQRGMELFRGKGRCAFCHKGYDFTDSDFHNIGVPSKPHVNEFNPFFFLKSTSPLDDDMGRYAVTHREEDRHAFKTPTLRNITETGPYMHNGVFKTLREVMEFYNHGGVQNADLDIEMKPVKMSSLEIQDLLDFMETLKGDIPVIEKPELP